MNTTWLENLQSSFGAQLFSIFTSALLLPIFVTAPSSAQTDTALNGTGNVFLTANVLGTGGGGPSYLTVADFNGDGHADVVVANTGSNTVGVLPGQGEGTFWAPVVT